MDSYLLLFVLILVFVFYENTKRRMIKIKMKKKRGLMMMTNELLKSYIGRNCFMYMGSFGTNVAGKILSVNENWVEVESKKGIELVNAEFVQSIKIIDK